MISPRRFSIDRWVLGGALAVAALGPTLLVAAPALWRWVRAQRRARARDGLQVLWPALATTVERYAAAMIPADPPEVPWAEVARRVDRFLASGRSDRGWRVPTMVATLALAPLLGGLPPAPWARRDALSAFCRRRLATSRGAWGRLALVRQLVRMAYYGHPAAQRRMGFVPFEARGPMLSSRRAGAAWAAS